MRRLLVFFVLAGCAFAQDPAQSPERGGSAHLPPVPQVSANVTERLVPVTHADLYCSGFLAKAPARTDTYVIGGLNSPHQTRFHERDFVFINGDFAVGSRVSFVRQTKDVDRTEAFKGQMAALKNAGDVFGELGYAVVVEKRPDTLIAKVEFSCDAIVPGDYVVPFTPKADVTYRERTTVDQFPAGVKPVGRIIASRDFDQYVATGQKVYLNTGAKNGVKPGDLFYIVRNYNRDEMDAADQFEFKTGSFDETRKNTPKMPRNVENKMPEHVVGEAVVLSAQDTSATAMITFALSEVHVGDRIASETPGAGASSSASSFGPAEHEGKSAHVPSICSVFAILNCGKQAEITREMQRAKATHGSGSAADSAGSVGGSK